jgi:hypothetical protein
MFPLLTKFANPARSPELSPFHRRPQSPTPKLSKQFLHIDKLSRN